MSRPARRLFAATALAAVLGALAALGWPAAAFAGSADPAPTLPEDGAFVDGASVVLEWTDVAAPEGYQVSWTATDVADEAGVATATLPTMTIAVAGGSYEWRVRVLPDGEWSAPATFHVDLELPTLGLPEDGSAAPLAGGRGADRIPGGLWVGGAVGFAAVFLVIVVVQSRRHREQDA
jgi:hypothetical protein